MLTPSAPSRLSLPPLPPLTYKHKGTKVSLVFSLQLRSVPIGVTKIDVAVLGITGVLPRLVFAALPSACQ